MSVPEEERRDAEKTAELIRKKLMEMMDLQADIDALLRDKHPTPFGSKHWEYACIEALQRVVAMTAIQFVLFEPIPRRVAQCRRHVPLLKWVSLAQS